MLSRVCTLALVFCAASAAAQVAPSPVERGGPVPDLSDVRAISSPNPTAGGNFAFAVAGISDANGDGRGDVLIGAYREDTNAGQAYLFSGSDGRLLQSYASPNREPDETDGGNFGLAVASVPDADGDSLDDVLIGAPGEIGGRGRAYLFSGASGAWLATLTVPTLDIGSQFGATLAGVPDVSGDGRGELLIGAPAQGGTGRAYLFSGATGTLIRDVLSPSSAGSFGRSVGGVADVDGDGLGDLLVGDTDVEEGRAYLISGAPSGQVLFTFEAQDPSDGGNFGRAITGVPDTDGDGLDDILVGAGNEDDGGVPNAGSVYLFSSATGARLHTLVSPDAQENGRFGVSVSGVPDVDGDGRGDLVVGAWKEAVGDDAEAGQAYLFSGATGALIRSFESPNAIANGNFGRAVAGVADMDGNGRGNVVVGAWREGSGNGLGYLFYRENTAPAAADDAASTFRATPVVVDVAANDQDKEGDTFAVVGIQPPGNGAAVLVDGGIQYTPEATFRNVETFSYTVRDAFGAEATATVRVTITNRPPTADDDAATTDRGSPALVDVLDGDTDPDDDLLTVSVTTAPDHGAVAVVSGGIRYTPDGSYLGEDTFQYSVRDGFGGEATATVTITIVNLAPVAAPDAATTYEGTPVIMDVIANDGDPDGDDLTLQSVGEAADGSTEVEGGRVRYTPDPGFSGADAFGYVVTDGNGETAEGTVTVTVVATVVTVRVEGEPVAGSAATITATVAGLDVFSDGARLFFRPGGGGAYTNVPLADQGGEFRATIPANAVTARGLDYYTSFSDGSRTVVVPAQAPASPTHARVRVTGLASPVRPGAEAEYRMVSVPVALADATATAVFGDDYGAYDPQGWRLFRWDPVAERYAEAPDAATALPPGAAAWLVMAAPREFDVDAGLSVASMPASVTLAPGWNQIGGPFAFPVSWSAVSGSGAVGPPALWDGAEYLLDRPTLDPWEGYFVHNDTGSDVTLVVPPMEAAATPSAKGDEEGYRLHVAATVPGRPGLRDTQNVLAFAAATVPGRDLREPPPIGDHLRLSVIGAEGTRLAHSYQPDGGAGAVWDVEVAATDGALGAEGLDARLAIVENGARPEGYGLFVFDAASGAPLASDGDIVILLRASAPVRRLRVVVGTEAFAQASASASGAFALLPAFPNPAAGPVTIRYRLAQAGPAVLDVFDALGRRVAILADGDHEAGAHAVRWEARGLASGSYLYRLRTGAGEVAVGRLHLVR